MRKYQRNRVQITGNPTQQRESEKRERVLEALSSVVAKLGGGNAIPPALQLTSAINPPAGSGFAWLLGGRPGGQLGLGGTGSGQSATIGSNPNRDGKVFFGSAQQTAYDEANERIGINTPNPAARLHLRHVGAHADPLLRFDNDTDVNDLNYGSDGASGTDLIFSGASLLMLGMGGGSSGLRVGTIGTNARIEAGASDQSNMNLVLSGNRQIQGTLLTLNFIATLLSGDMNFSTFKAIAMVCDNGAILPTSPPPVKGQLFLHTPAGRDVFMLYTGSTWMPIASLGAVTMYVSTTGTNSQNNGGVDGTSAFLTIQFALDQVPASFNGNVIINIGPGTFAESPVIATKRSAGNFLLTLQGNGANAAYVGTPETITGHDGGVVGTAASPGPQVQATVTRSSGTWVVNAYQGMIVRIQNTTGSALDASRVIESNTATAITLCGNPLTRSVVSTDTITIYPVSSASEPTQITGSGGIASQAGQIRYSLNDLKFNLAAGTRTAFFIDVSGATLNRCVHLNRQGILVSGGLCRITTSFIKPSTAATIGIYSFSPAAAGKPAAISIENCYILNNGTGATVGVFSEQGSTISISGGTVIDGFATGANVMNFGSMGIVGSTTILGAIFRNCTNPIVAATNGFWSQNVPNAATFVSGTNINMRIVEPIEFGTSVGIGIVANALLHLAAGTAVAGTAPLKLTSGINMTTPEAGAMEYDGAELYFSPSTTRRKLGLVTDGGSLITSGVYTPTRSSETNLDANVTMSEAQYLRIGNTVTVSGRFTADPTLPAVATNFEITLPIASDLGTAEDLAGVAFCGAIAGQGAEIIGVAANNTAQIQWVSGDTTSQTWSYTFTYQII